VSDLTHDHLDALATRLETSYRRECDQMRVEIRDDIADLKSVVKVQNSRIGKSEMSIGELREDGRVLAHDFKNHLTVHALSSPVAAPLPLTRGFTAGVTATVIILVGAAYAAWDWAVTYLPGLVHAMRKP